MIFMFSKCSRRHHQVIQGYLGYWLQGGGKRGKERVINLDRWQRLHAGSLLVMSHTQLYQWFLKAQDLNLSPRRLAATPPLKPLVLVSRFRVLRYQKIQMTALNSYNKKIIALFNTKHCLKNKCSLLWHLSSLKSIPEQRKIILHHIKLTVSQNKFFAKMFRKILLWSSK